jgi:hypothetical protein
MAAAASLAHAQGVTPDYSIAPYGAGLSLQAGARWFGQVGLAQTPTSPLVHSGTNDAVNLSGGYRFGGGQSLSLQLSMARGSGPGQRLGLSVNYDWPRYFVRFSYDPQRFTLQPQESVRVSAGVKF